MIARFHEEEPPVRWRVLIVSGTVDIGAYEFQGAGSVISYAWLQHYGLPTDGSADFTDSDADGHTTWQEWRCQTDPTNALSALRLQSAMRAGMNVIVSFDLATWTGRQSLVPLGILTLLALWGFRQTLGRRPAVFRTPTTTGSS